MKTTYHTLFIRVPGGNLDELKSELSEDLKILQQDDNEVIRVEFLKEYGAGYFAVIHFRCPVVEDKGPILNTKLVDCDLPTRVLNGLTSIECRTVEDLTKLKEKDLRHIRNFGNRSICLTEELLESMNLSLKT